MFYRHIIKSILFRFDPELVHDVCVSLGSKLGATCITRTLLGLVYDYRGKDVSRTIDGIHYRTPILLAAGFDYNGRLTRVLPHIGFGGEEIGSVTARAYAGNPKPRLTRLPQSQSIIVNKGLKNEGVDAVIGRLQQLKSRRAKDFVLGISIARTNDEQSATSIEAGIADYIYSYRKILEAGVADYITINISCPNSFGGETFARPEPLERLLKALSGIPCSIPVYVKMPINLPWDEFCALLKIIDTYKLQGVVIGNLNKDYSSLKVRSEAPSEYRGGLSGVPCRDLSNELIHKTKETYKNRFTIIGVGGVMSPDDAQAKFAAGADLVQLITGMIYEGPGLIKEIAKSI